MSTVNGLLILRQAIAGDVVISHSPQNPRHVVCKRVLGLAGDTVQVARTSQHGPTSVQVLPALTAWRLAPCSMPYPCRQRIQLAKGLYELCLRDIS